MRTYYWICAFALFLCVSEGKAVAAEDALGTRIDAIFSPLADNKSPGVAALVRVVRQAAASGSGLRIAASAPVVTRVLALTGVDKLIEIYPSVAAALGDDIAADATDETAHAVLPPQADPEESAPQPG